MKVLSTKEEWLSKAYRNYWNDKNTAGINPSIDADGDFILGLSVLDDPTWNLTLPVTNPETGETKPIKDWLYEKEYRAVIMEEN